MNEVGIASGYVDRFSHIAAQDEALYANSSLTMARGGDWLTPQFLHRFGLYKPPILYWTSAGSMKLFGESPLALRLPSVLAAAGVATLVFLWAGGGLAALGAVLLLVSNPLFHTLGRMALTDMLLLLWICAAGFVLHRDPRLQRLAPVYGIFTGLALMTKGAAGLLPLLILAVYWLIASEKPAFSRLMVAGAAAIIVAAPWHIYQYAVHQRWFWAEYVLTEHVAFGLQSPPQTTQENQALFYLKRLAILDAPLLVACLFGLRKDRLLLAWVAVICASVMAYQYRNVSYLLPMIPALCILASRFPKLWIMAALLLVVRPMFPDAPYGISFRTGSTIPSAQALNSYSAMKRPHELILVEPDDEFLSATLPLPHVRYIFIAPPEPGRRYALDFYELGIAMRAPEFNSFEQARAKYSPRLKAWGLPDDRSLATSILATGEAEIAEVVRKHPGSDFLFRRNMPDSPAHNSMQLPGGYTILLAK